MRQMAIWAAFILVCGSIGLAQGGAGGTVILKKSGNTRLIEGGRYNVNLRWNGTPSVEVHDKTIDTWYVLAGGATVNTGYQVKDGERVPSAAASNVETWRTRTLFSRPPGMVMGLANARNPSRPLGSVSTLSVASQDA